MGTTSASGTAGRHQPAAAGGSRRGNGHDARHGWRHAAPRAGQRPVKGVRRTTARLADRPPHEMRGRREEAEHLCSRTTTLSAPPRAVPLSTHGWCDSAPRADRWGLPHVRLVGRPRRRGRIPHPRHRTSSAGRAAQLGGTWRAQCPRSCHWMDGWLHLYNQHQWRSGAHAGLGAGAAFGQAAVRAALAVRHAVGSDRDRLPRLGPRPRGGRLDPGGVLDGRLVDLDAQVGVLPSAPFPGVAVIVRRFDGVSRAGREQTQGGRDRRRR